MAEPTLHQRLLDAIVYEQSAIRSALHAVVELHAPVETVVMAKTDDAGQWQQRAFESGDQVMALDGVTLVCFAEKTPTNWPCNTIRAIAEQLGVTVDG